MATPNAATPYAIPSVGDRATPPALATAIAEWFPELEGRALAISDAEVTKENLPTLPLCFVALHSEQADHSSLTNGRIKITERLLVQFWQAPASYRRADGSESPFWAFYDYGAIRDRLLVKVLDWHSPVGMRLAYQSLDIASDSFAVCLSFRFDHYFEWRLCPEIVDACGKPIECIAPQFRVRMLPHPNTFGGMEPVDDPCAKIGQTVKIP